MNCNNCKHNYLWNCGVYKMVGLAINQEHVDNKSDLYNEIGNQIALNCNRFSSRDFTDSLTRAFDGQDVTEKFEEKK